MTKLAKIKSVFINSTYRTTLRLRFFLFTKPPNFRIIVRRSAVDSISTTVFIDTSRPLARIKSTTILSIMRLSVNGFGQAYERQKQKTKTRRWRVRARHYASSYVIILYFSRQLNARAYVCRARTTFIAFLVLTHPSTLLTVLEFVFLFCRPRERRRR